MKCNRLFLIISISLLSTFIGWARNDMPASNTFQDFSSYFNRNIARLNPVEGIYEVTMFAHLPGHSDGVQWKYKVAIYEYEDSNDRLIMSFLGYQNPFSGFSIPQQEVDENPLVSIPHAVLLLLNTPYTYGCCLLEPGRRVSAEKFQAMGPLFLDPNTYDFEADIEVYSTEFLDALKMPKSVYRVNGDKVEVILSMKGERLSICPSPVPVSNVGKTLSVIKDEFSDLQYIDRDDKGDVYASGIESSITQYFTIKNNVVVEEALVCGSEDEFAHDFFIRYRNTFLEKYKDAVIRDAGNEIKFIFPYYSLTATCSRKSDMNFAQIVFRLL